MTAHRTTRSDEIAAIADLVADALAMPAAMLPRPRREIDLTRADPDHAVITIPESTVSLVDGLGEYGA